MSIPQSTYQIPFYRNSFNEFEVDSFKEEEPSYVQNLKFIRDISSKIFRLFSIPDPQAYQKMSGIILKIFDVADDHFNDDPAWVIDKIRGVHDCLLEYWNSSTLTYRINREVQALFKTLNSSIEQLSKPSPMRIKKTEKKHKEPEEHSQKEKSKMSVLEKGKILNLKKAQDAIYANRLAVAEAGKRNLIASNVDSIWDNSDDPRTFIDDQRTFSDC